jgi:hypothetical protein
MPLELASSVDVVSTDRAHRRHLNTSTEAAGRESMLYRPAEIDPPEDDRSESDDE